MSLLSILSSSRRAKPTSSNSPSAPSTPSASSGARLVAVDGRTLPLRSAALRVTAGGGLARVVLEQRFENTYADPLSVTYALPLPADAAVSGFAFAIGERRFIGEVTGKQVARERFEAAILEGRSAALLEEERSSLFTQEIGNIPPRQTVVVETTLDQRLAWLDEGAWEWRFPTVVAPRYLGAEGRVGDADKVTVDVAKGPIGARASLALTIADRLREGRAPESPSHRLATSAAHAELHVTLDGDAKLDRDVVVRWPVAAESPRASLRTSVGATAATKARAFGLLTLVPPLPETRGRAVARDLVFLIDTSGSMGGRPLAQAQAVVLAMLDTLTERDTVELIEFSNEPTRFQSGAARCTPALKSAAAAWVKRLRASGGTEMREGIMAALKPLHEGAQRQVILLTDGLIGFEHEIVRALVDHLPKGSRVSTVGIGSGVNRSLTAPAARAGRGTEIILGVDEDPERAAARLVARTNAPIVTDLCIEGDALVEHRPRALPDLYAGSPTLLSLELRPQGGTLSVTGTTAEGAWKLRLAVAPVARGEAGGAGESGGASAVATLFGREAVEDLETEWATFRDQPRVDAAIERAGVDFQIATRLTSWIAVSDERTVDPGAPSRTERMPHELPYGMSAEGLGLSVDDAGGLAQAMEPMPAMEMDELLMEDLSTATRAGYLPSPMQRAEEAPLMRGGAASSGRQRRTSPPAQPARPASPMPTGAPPPAPKGVAPAPSIGAPPPPPPMAAAPAAKADMPMPPPAPPPAPTLHAPQAPLPASAAPLAPPETKPVPAPGAVPTRGPAEHAEQEKQEKRKTAVEAPVAAQAAPREAPALPKRHRPTWTVWLALLVIVAMVAGLLYALSRGGAPAPAPTAPRTDGMTAPPTPPSPTGEPRR